MTHYRTKYNAELIEHEFYRCHDCGEETEAYGGLAHYDEHSGGFCPSCGSDFLTTVTKYTVYAVLYARNAEEALDDAVSNGEFQCLEGSINLMEKQQ